MTASVNAVQVWDTSSGKLLMTLEGHQGTVESAESAAYSPDGSRIVTASKDHTAKVWDALSLAVSSGSTAILPRPAPGSNMVQTVLDTDTCSTMTAYLNLISYTQKGEFPNPDKHIFESDKPYSVQCGSTIFSSDGKNSAYVKSNSIDNLFKAIASGDYPYFNFNISFFQVINMRL